MIFSPIDFVKIIYVCYDFVCYKMVVVGCRSHIFQSRYTNIYRLLLATFITAQQDRQQLKWMSDVLTFSCPLARREQNDFIFRHYLLLFICLVAIHLYKSIGYVFSHPEWAVFILSSTLYVPCSICISPVSSFSQGPYCSWKIYCHLPWSCTFLVFLSGLIQTRYLWFMTIIMSHSKKWYYDIIWPD